MVELIFDDYNGPKHLGQFNTANDAWEAMVEYLKTKAGLNHDPYYYNIHEYHDLTKEPAEHGVNVDYGSYTRFFRLVGGKINDLQSS